MRKLFVTDIYAHSSEHSMFAESFIEYFNENFECEYLLNEVHATYSNENSRFLLDDTKIKNKWLRLVNREIFKLLSLVKRLPQIKRSNQIIVLLGTSNIQFYFLSILFSMLRIKFSVVMHSQLEILNPSSKRRRFGGLFIKALDKVKKNENGRVLVLGEHILKNINLLGYKSGFYSIPHPIPKSRISKQFKNESNEKKGLFGIVGLIRNDTKKCGLIYSLKLNENRNIKVVGRRHNDFEVKASDQIQFKLWDDIYTDEEFMQEIEDISGFLYFFGESDYKYTASGSALDALLYKKSVVTMRNNAVISLLQGYPYLYVCDTIEDMEKLINSNEVLLPIDDKVYEFSQGLVLGNSNETTVQLNKWLHGK